MENMEYIDSYFKGELPSGETGEFEKKIVEDPVFAEEVAFYLSALQAAREESTEEKKKRFREIYRQSSSVIHARPVKDYGHTWLRLLLLPE